ncbi:MAG: ABC transporter permease [Bacteroidota bacterium]
MFKNYLTIAYRNLIKQKWFSLINVLGLAIGMAVAMLVGLWVYDELTYDTYHKNYDHLAQVMIHQTLSGQTRTNVAISMPLGPALREGYGDDFTALSFGSWEMTHLISYGDKKITETGMHVEPNFPEMFSLELLSGTYEEALNEPNSILLAEPVAKALFGDEDPYGKIVRQDNMVDLKVTGVFKDLPENSSFRNIDILAPWELYKNQREWTKRASTQWGNHSFQMFVQIAPHTTFEAVSEKIAGIENEFNPNAKPELFLFPLKKWHLYGEFKNGVNVGGRIQYVWLFGITGIFVLLLACINFMNLSTARSEKRAKEVGIRKAVGSLRTQLIGQFLSEALLVGLLAVVISLVIVQLAIPGFNELADKDISLPLGNPIFWMLLIGFTLITSLLAGSYPAFYLSSFSPLKALKGSFKTGKWATVPREILVVFQFVISIALIVGTLVVFQQINHAKERTVGYDRTSLIQFPSNIELEGKGEILLNELKNTGYVEEASYSLSPVTNVWSNSTSINWEGKDPDALFSFAKVTSSPEHGKTLGWKVLEGRDFSRQFSTDSSAIIFNEAAADIIGGGESIIGKTVTWQGNDLQVIGVVEDILMDSPWHPVKPTAFTLNSDWFNYFTVRLKAGAPLSDALASVEEVFVSLCPDTPFDYEFVDEEFASKFSSEERIKNLARIFAFLAIFISCLGLLGLSSYVAEQRTKEIGIRKVLGATVKHLWALQSKNFMKLILISCLIAVPVAWYYLDGWLSGYEYRISLGWDVFVMASFLALVVTLLTVSIQSIRAAVANPVDSLRSE